MRITDNVYLLDYVLYSHVYLITGDTPVLIDSGMPGFAGAILKETCTLLGGSSSLRHIFLTHHDVDHVGNALALAEKTGARFGFPDRTSHILLVNRNGPDSCIYLNPS